MKEEFTLVDEVEKKKKKNGKVTISYAYTFEGGAGEDQILQLRTHDRLNLPDDAVIVVDFVDIQTRVSAKKTVGVKK